MHGSLCYKNGILYVGKCAKTADIAAYDLDGHRLETNFQFRDVRVGRSAASGLAVDDDHRIWVADTPAERVHAFTLFGQEVVSIGGDDKEAEDARGRLGGPVDVATEGEDDDLAIWIASGGVRRHAVQRFLAHHGRVLSMRPMGDPRGLFQGVSGIAARARDLFVCEAGAERIQVFREDEFHYALPVPRATGAGSEPTAIAVLEDGRLAVTVAGEASAVLLLDAAGRLLRVLADGGAEAGEVAWPSDVAVVEGDDDGSTRVAVIDRDGDRVQVFTLAGRCYGAFERA